MKRISNRDLAFVDLETTGSEPGRHEVIEISVLLASEPLVPWSQRIRPERISVAEPRALEVNGYDAVLWLHEPKLRDVLPEIVKRLDGCVIVAHNLFGFDLRFLKAAYEAHGYPTKWLGWPGVDTMSMAYSVLVPRGLEKLNLNAVCEFLDVPPEAQVHRASEGARRCYQIHERMMKVIHP